MSSGTNPRFTVDSTSQALYRPPTLQHSSNLRGLIKTGKILIGTSLSYPSRHVAKTVAVTGAEDAEHVAWSPELLVECIQVIIHESGGKMIPVIRVPSKTAFDYMAWCLNAGAGGIIVPHIETVEEAQGIIDACRFPPTGHRSFPPFTFARSLSYNPLWVIPGVTDTTLDGESVFSLANRHVAIIPQIESPLGIQNLNEILALDEVSAFMIGHGDLRLEMGLSLSATGTEPQYIQALDRATRLSRDHGKPIVGPAFGPEMIKLRISQGYKLVVCCFDLHAFAFGMIKAVSEGRATAEEYMQSIQSA
ncbi:Pyruvate/Phosphoenolpyruvate kinase-like domain-containing protein [Mycena haematopus]|nr:Pyruvate/Phosphoenolpyruvate kinase-like domain-containing protein [Mycena haematopus]